MNKKIKKNIKLTGLLIGNEKKLMLCSFVSVIVGFTFMFMVSSLSGTIIKTKQDNTVNKYGKFLMVLPDIDNESEKEIKQKCIDFKYEHFGVVGNVEYANKKITIGTMTEDMGATLAFKLIKGKWVKGSDQIVVEEYLLKLFGKENIHVMHYIPEYYQMRDRCKAVVQTGDYGVHAQAILIAGYPSADIPMEWLKEGLKHD